MRLDSPVFLLISNSSKYLENKWIDLICLINLIDSLSIYLVKKQRAISTQCKKQFCHNDKGVKSASKLTRTTADNIIETTKASSLSENVFVRDLVERHIWEASAELCRGNCYEVLLKRGATSRDAVTGISRSHASLPPGVFAYNQRNLPSLEGVFASICVYVRISPEPRYAALIKPTAKRETHPAANSNDPECTYGCFGENKWAENGIHKHSWYREGRGGERRNSSSGAARQIPLSHTERSCFCFS